MTTLQAADGRLLRARRPAGADVWGRGGLMPASFPPMWSDGTRGGDEEDGRWLKSFEAIYRSQPVIAGVVDKLTRRVATLPLEVMRSLPDGTRESARGSSLDTLLRCPMPRSSIVHLLAFIEQSLLVNGNCVIAKLRTGPDREMPPTMLWPLDWAMLNGYGEAGGTIEYWSTTQFSGQERFIRAEDTVHFAWPGPSGCEIGVSPLEKLGVTIRFEDAAQREQTSIFRNGIRPSAAVTYEGDPTVEQLDRAGAIVKAAHRGIDRSGSWVWMGANVKVAPLSWSPVDAELIEQRKRSWEEIAAVYDMAGPLSGDLSHGTYSNVQVILDSLYRDVVPPWTTLICETLQTQLINPEPAWLDLHVRFDFTDKLRGDPVAAAEADRSDVEAGVRTRDEIRTSRGFPPAGGAAAELTMNANNQAPVESAGTSNSPPPGVNGR